ncbi:SHOCT domain-containing protein [Streptacidiphilus monticola]
MKGAGDAHPIPRGRTRLARRPLVPALPLFWIAVLVLARRLLFRGAWAGRGPRGRGPWQDRRWQERGGPAPTPVETLNRKYADGEIDEFEYRTRLSVLTGEDETT